MKPRWRRDSNALSLYFQFDLEISPIWGLEAFCLTFRCAEPEVEIFLRDRAIEVKRSVPSPQWVHDMTTWIAAAMGDGDDCIEALVGWICGCCSML